MDGIIIQAVEDQQPRWVELSGSQLLADGFHEATFVESLCHSVVVLTHPKDRDEPERYSVPKRCIKQIVGMEIGE